MVWSETQMTVGGV